MDRQLPEPGPGLTHDVFAELHELRQRVSALEARRGARDATELAVLPTIVDAFGSRQFTSADLKAYSELEEPRAQALKAALEAADVTTIRECGKLLARLETSSPIDGFVFRRAGYKPRVGVLWEVS